jgi:hypothetical protein
VHRGDVGDDERGNGGVVWFAAMEIGDVGDAGDEEWLPAARSSECPR